jgi:endoglucanase
VVTNNVRFRRLRLTAALGAGALAAGLLTATASPAGAAAPTPTSTPYGNLAEALQKSIYFYDAEKSGPSRSAGRQPLEWRGDSEPEDSKIELAPVSASQGEPIVTHGTNLSKAFIDKNRTVLDPDGDGYLDLSRGMHDAGDHVKFGLPQTYSAATLAWGVTEFKDAYVKTGTYDHILDELYWFNDYFLKSTFLDSSGNVVAFAYQVGNGSVDHTVWGPPELMTHRRGAMFATAETPGSDQAAGAAAALTAMHQVVKEKDPTYAAKCLTAAKALYRFAKEHRGLGESGGYYGSSADEDEMSWAAVWLYQATGDIVYVNDIVAKNASGIYTGYMKKLISDVGSTWQNIWVHSWDTVWGGVFAKLAPLTKGVIDDTLNKQYWYYFRWNVEYWTAGAVKHVGNISGDSYMKASPAGFSVVNTWGSARYNTAAQLCALIYRNYAARDPEGSEKHGEDLTRWALSQMNYIMGDNPLHRSYIVGFTAKSSDGSVKHPHHRAAHGSLTNSMFDPAEHRHTLWGALAGGPDEGDNHKDETNDFVYNEVAIDYNAGFVGALAGLWKYFGSGQTVTAWTPPAEPKGKNFYTEAKVEQENKQRTQVTIRIHQEQATPPALIDDLSARYYFDVGELVEHGQSIKDVRYEVYYDEAKTRGETAVKITGPTLLSGTVYYLQAEWTGAFYDKRDLQIGIIAAQDTTTWTDHWDPTNDYSREGLSTSKLTESPRVPAYRAGKKVFGTEPGEKATA